MPKEWLSQYRPVISNPRSETHDLYTGWTADKPGGKVPRCPNYCKLLLKRHIERGNVRFDCPGCKFRGWTPMVHSDDGSYLGKLGIVKTPFPQPVCQVDWRIPGPPATKGESSRKITQGEVPGKKKPRGGKPRKTVVSRRSDHKPNLTPSAPIVEPSGSTSDIDRPQSIAPSPPPTPPQSTEDSVHPGAKTPMRSPCEEVETPPTCTPTVARTPVDDSRGSDITSLAELGLTMRPRAPVRSTRAPTKSRPSASRLSVPAPPITRSTSLPERLSPLQHNNQSQPPSPSSSRLTIRIPPRPLSAQSDSPPWSHKRQHGLEQPAAIDPDALHTSTGKANHKRQRC